MTTCDAGSLCCYGMPCGVVMDIMFLFRLVGVSNLCRRSWQYLAIGV